MIPPFFRFVERLNPLFVSRQRVNATWCMCRETNEEDEYNFFFFLELKRKNCVICVEFLLLSVIYGGNVISVCDEMLFHLCIPIFGEQVFFLFLYFNFTSYTDSYCYL